MTRHTAVPETAPGFLSVLKPLFFSLCITFLALCLLAGLICFGPVTEAAADTCILFSTVMSVLPAGFLAARQKDSRGFLMGGLTGLLYALVAYCIAALCFGSMSPGSGFLRLAAISTASGAIGGIFGVNTRRKKRK